jgi:hypothetical protein
VSKVYNVRITTMNVALGVTTIHKIRNGTHLQLRCLHMIFIDLTDLTLVTLLFSATTNYDLGDLYKYTPIDKCRAINYHLEIFTFATASYYITLWRAMRIYHLIDTFATSRYRRTWWQRVKFQHFVAFFTFFLKSGMVMDHKCKVSF